MLWTGMPLFEGRPARGQYWLLVRNVAPVVVRVVVLCWL